MKWLYNLKEKVEFINIKTPSKSKHVKINIDASSNIKTNVIILFYEYQEIFA